MPDVLTVAIHATRPIPGRKRALVRRIEVEDPMRLRGEWGTRVEFHLVGLFCVPSSFVFLLLSLAGTIGIPTGNPRSRNRSARQRTNRYRSTTIYTKPVMNRICQH